MLNSLKRLNSEHSLANGATLQTQRMRRMPLFRFQRAHTVRRPSHTFRMRRNVGRCAMVELVAFSTWKAPRHTLLAIYSMMGGREEKSGMYAFDGEIQSTLHSPGERISN